MAIAITVGVLVLAVIAMLGGFAADNGGKDRSAVAFWGIFLGVGLIALLLISVQK